MKKSLFVFCTALFTISTAYAHPENSRPDFSSFCKGKAVNSEIFIKNDGDSVEGTCVVGFKANQAANLERGVMRDPVVQNACKGKAIGTAVTVKVNGKSIAGKCEMTARIKRN